MSYHQFRIFEKIGTEELKNRCQYKIIRKDQPIYKAEYIFPL